jgi:HK97 family phage major capsid protein
MPWVYNLKVIVVGATYTEEQYNELKARLVDELVPAIQAKDRAARGADLAHPKANFAGPPDDQGDPHIARIGGDFITLYKSEVDKVRGVGDWLRCIVKARHPAYQDHSCHEKLVRSWNEGGYDCHFSLGDERGTYTRANIEGTGGAGGYTTPVLYEQQVAYIAAEMAVLVTRAQQKPLGARQVEYPALHQYTTPVAGSGQSAFFGGVQTYRKGEAVARVESDPAFKKITLQAQDLTAYTAISRDLLMDATTPIDTYVTKLMGEAIGWREDWESIQGTGIGQFQGVLTAPALYQQTRHTTTGLPAAPYVNQNFNAIDVFNMKAHMVVGARDPIWLIHPSSLPILLAMQDPTGRYIYTPYGLSSVGRDQEKRFPTDWAGGLAAGPTGGITFRPAGHLLGDPVFLSEKVPSAVTTTDSTHTNGTMGDIIYVDCDTYWVGRRSGLEVGISEHFLFNLDEIAIRAKTRNDARPGQLAPIVLADGSFKVSGLVTLALGTNN